MANKTIQLLRSNTVYTSHQDALDALVGQLTSTNAKDGQPILARYKVGKTGPERTLLGIKSAGGYEIFDNEGTSADIQAAIAALDAKVTSTDGTNVNVTVTEVDGKITGVSVTDKSINATNLSNAINALDSSVSATAAEGNAYSVLTGITQADGVLTGKTEVKLAAAAKTGAAADVSIADSGDKFTSTNVEGALAELASKVNANEITNADGSITVTPANGTTTDVKVHIKDGEQVIKLDDNEGGIYTDLSIKTVSSSETNVKEAWGLFSSNVQLGSTIKIYKDSSLLSVALLHADLTADPQVLPTYDKETGAWTDIPSGSQTEANRALCFAYENVEGTVVIAAVPVGSFINEQEFANGVTWNSSLGKVVGVVDSTSETFLTVGADGFKVSGVQNAINTAEAAAKTYTDGKIAGLDFTTDAASAGQYVAAIEETDGVVAVKTRANVSDAVLNGYEKGTKPASTAIVATDDVKGAIAKLEHQIDDAKAAATTKVEKVAQATHLTLTNSTAADGSVTYTIGESDIASKTDLDAEIAARKAVDGQTGQTYAANAGAKYIGGATSLNDADVKLDAALKAADESMLTGVTPGNGISVSDKSGNSQTITAVAVADDPIIKVTENGIATKEDAVWDCGSY